jgi:hypothetical protein
MKKILLIAIIIIVANYTKAQTAADATKKSKGFYGLGLSYLLSTNQKNTDPKKPLFAGNGFAITFTPGVVLNKNLCLMAQIGYQAGVTNTKELDAFAKTKLQTPFTYKTEVSNKTWGNLILAAGPAVAIPRFIFSASAGVQIGSARSITITKYDLNTAVGTIFNQKQNSSSFYWQATMEFVPFAGKSVKNKNSAGLTFSAGIGSNGVQAGALIRKPRWIIRPHY